MNSAKEKGNGLIPGRNKQSQFGKKSVEKKVVYKNGK